MKTALTWIAAKDQTIEGYMAEHQFDPGTIQLWNYFRNEKTPLAIGGTHKTVDRHSSSA